MNISDTPRISALRFYFKHQHEKLPFYFYNFNLTTQGSHHSYDTIEQIRTDKTRAEFCDNRRRIFLPKVMNSNPANLIQKIATHSLQGCSSNIRIYILDEYTEICSMANCYFCQRTWKIDNGQSFSIRLVRAKSTSLSKYSIRVRVFYLLHFCFIVTLFILFSGIKTPHSLSDDIWQLVVSVIAEH